MLKCCLSFPKCKNAVMCLREKNTCVRKASFMASSAVGHKFSINELPVYSKMSLNRNSHKTKLCIDRVDQNVTRGLQDPNPVCPPGAMDRCSR